MLQSYTLVIIVDMTLTSSGAGQNQSISPCAALQRSLNAVDLANEKELLQSCNLASRNANVHALKPEVDDQCREWAYRLVDLNSASCAMSWDDKLRTKEDYLLWQEASFFAQPAPSPCS